VGNGYYRCSITNAASTTGTGSLGVFTSANGVTSTYTGDGTSGIYIFGAQLSDSASVDPYVYQPVAAPTSTAYYGPRFDYDPVTLAPKGLLIEEQRTNLLTYSEQFDNAAWTKSGSTITANAVAAPDGTLTADALFETATTGQHSIVRLPGVGVATYTYSFFAKENGRTQVQIEQESGGTSRFTLTGNGTALALGSNTVSITAVGNGWYRCTTTFTVTGGFGIYTHLYNGTSTSYAGDITKGIFIWGAQLEAGAFATSYIPTVASQVTRAADSASMIGNNFARWFNQTAGSTLVDFNTFATSSLNVVEFNAGQSVNPISLYREATTWRYRTSLANLNLNGAQFVTNNKTAFVYAASDYVISVNGNPVQTNTGVGSIAPHTQLIIGGAASSFSYGANSSLNGTIKRIAYYPRRLANTELQGITS
jgi:hypothetical protein